MNGLVVVTVLVSTLLQVLCLLEWKRQARELQGAMRKLAHQTEPKPEPELKTPGSPYRSQPTDLPESVQVMTAVEAIGRDRLRPLMPQTRCPRCDHPSFVTSRCFECQEYKAAAHYHAQCSTCRAKWLERTPDVIFNDARDRPTEKA